MESQDANPKRGFLIPLDLIVRARKAGINMERLQDMVRLSARCTHSKGNRRFEDTVFMIVGKRVVNFTQIEPEVAIEEPEKFYRCVTCQDTKRVRVFDQCDHCEGLGCPRCDEGLVPGNIPCPACYQKERLASH